MALRLTAVAEILDLWAQRSLFEEKDFVEQVPATDKKKKTPKEILDQCIATLKRHVVNVMTADPLAKTMSTTELKLGLLRDLCNSCKYLLQAFDGVMIKNPKTPMPDKDGLTLDVFKKFCRRLWRVLRYSAGPQIFLIKGRSILKAKIMLARGNSNTIKIEDPVWVAKDTKLAPLFSTAQQEIIIAKDTFISWFRQEIISKSTASAANKNSAIVSITSYCNRAKFNNGIIWRPSLHCEVTLLAYLYLASTRIISNAIGVSKLNCFACSVYTDGLKSGSPGAEYNMTGSSGKFHHQWLILNSALFSNLPLLKIASTKGAQMVISETKERIYKFLDGTVDSGSVGSDSSTGSGGMDLNEVFLLGP